MMKSKVPLAVHLTAEKIIRKFNRGFSEHTVRMDGKVVVVQWYDQKPISIASTVLAVEPSDRCKR